MDSFFVLILLGFAVGAIGTLIGAGGGFILVPLLILTMPQLSPDEITAISMGVVACNAISGSAAYMKSKRVDFKAGIVFAICTIPGSILGVFTTKFIPRDLFDIIFGVVLIALSIFLFIKGGKKKSKQQLNSIPKNWIERKLTDRYGETYHYAYNLRWGILISILVGYFSPLLGIGGGIIHVPAMSEWLLFPVHIATATSHFILAVMATVSVITHWIQGSYNDPIVQRMLLFLALGVIPGAQVGAWLSRKIKGKFIIRGLAIALMVVGIRILFTGL